MARHSRNASRARAVEQSIENYRLFQGVREFAVERRGPSSAPAFDAWLVRNAANRYYGNMLSYCRVGDFKGLRRIGRFVKSKYPAARRRALMNPKVMARYLVAAARGCAKRLLVRETKEAGAR